jgi:hypothetical protein
VQQVTVRGGMLWALLSALAVIVVLVALQISPCATMDAIGVLIAIRIALDFLTALLCPLTISLVIPSISPAMPIAVNRRVIVEPAITGWIFPC